MKYLVRTKELQWRDGLYTIEADSIEEVKQEYEENLVSNMDVYSDEFAALDYIELLSIEEFNNETD